MQLSPSSRAAQFAAEGQKLAAAEAVVVVGGGTVGVELAAEIVGRWPGKNVTLVASQERLLERMPSGVSQYCLKWLTARGVQVVRPKEKTCP
jgi:NADH dehydrogenase FAD-containing subunit